MRTTLKRTVRTLGAGAGAAIAAGLGYVGLTWARYGKVERSHSSDPLLDGFMPEYEVREVHQTRVRAPAEVTNAVARQLDLRRSPLIRAIFAGRQLLMGADRSTNRQQPSFLEQVLALGWRVLADEPSREIVIGAVTQPWKANVVFRGIAPEEFPRFNERGYAKIAWTLVVDPVAADSSIFRTETRVATTDPESRARFRRYWTIMSPGILLIRRETLRLVQREAERRKRFLAEPGSEADLSGQRFNPARGGALPASRDAPHGSL